MIRPRISSVAPCREMARRNCRRFFGKAADLRARPLVEMVILARANSPAPRRVEYPQRPHQVLVMASGSPMPIMTRLLISRASWGSGRVSRAGGCGPEGGPPVVRRFGTRAARGAGACIPALHGPALAPQFLRGADCASSPPGRWRKAAAVSAGPPAWKHRAYAGRSAPRKSGLAGMRPFRSRPRPPAATKLLRRVARSLAPRRSNAYNE